MVDAGRVKIEFDLLASDVPAGFSIKYLLELRLGVVATPARALMTVPVLVCWGDLMTSRAAESIAIRLGLDFEDCFGHLLADYHGGM